jgi:hypothetical protein
MPAFNANLFKLATPQYLCNHVYQLNEATDELIHEQSRLDTVYRNTLKQHKKQQNKSGGEKAQLEESQGNKIDLFLLSRQVDELCNQINDCGIPVETELLKGLNAYKE